MCINQNKVKIWSWLYYLTWGMRSLSFLVLPGFTFIHTFPTMCKPFLKQFRHFHLLLISTPWSSFIHSPILIFYFSFVTLTGCRLYREERNRSLIHSAGNQQFSFKEEKNRLFCNKHLEKQQEKQLYVVCWQNNAICFFLNQYIFPKYVHYKSNCMNSNSRGLMYYIIYKVYFKVAAKDSGLAELSETKQTLLALNFC